MEFSTPSIYLIASPPRSGKSVLIKHIIHSLHKKNKLSYGICFSGSLFNGDYDFLPQKYLFSNYNESVVKSLLKLQIEQIREKGTASPAFIIFDDMIGSMNLSSKIMQMLITRYRHFNILLIFAIQYIYKAPPTLRECATFFITFNQSTKISIKAIHETFMQDFETYKKCKDYITSNCKNFHFILVEKDESEKNKYKVLKAPIHNKIEINY